MLTNVTLNVKNQELGNEFLLATLSNLSIDRFFLIPQVEPTFLDMITLSRHAFA